MKPRSRLLTGGFAVLALCVGVRAGGSAAETAGAEVERRTRTIISGAFCTCGCGNALPGNPGSACFGCSVGKAEVSFVRQALREGTPVAEIVLALGEPVTLSVFADYGDAGLAQAWALSLRVAREFEQHRVVLRTPGRSPDAVHAVKVVECAREVGRFAAVRDALIAHEGPWSEGSSRALAEAQGVEAAGLSACLARIDVSDQVERDAHHARLGQIVHFPSLSVNGETVEGGEDELRRRVERAIRDESV